MPRGGKRPGAGRPFGSKNTIPPDKARYDDWKQMVYDVELHEYINEDVTSAYEIIRMIYQSKHVPLRWRLAAAKEAMNFEPKPNGASGTIDAAQVESYREKLFAEIDAIAASADRDEVAARAEQIKVAAEQFLSFASTSETDRDAEAAAEFLIAEFERQRAVRIAAFERGEAQPKPISEIMPPAQPMPQFRKITAPTIDLDSPDLGDQVATPPMDNLCEQAPQPEINLPQVSPQPPEDLIEVVAGVDRTGRAITRWMPRQTGGYD